MIRCGSPTDGTCDAPGANDDASGTAAVVEMARVMAKYKFDATIVFMAVAGEEQSLLGSTYFAEQAKQKQKDIAGMFTNDIVGNTLGGNGVRDRRTLRVFSEGVPSNESADQATTAQCRRRERFAFSTASRFIKEVGERYVPQMKIMMVYRRDRYGRGGGSHSFLSAALKPCALPSQMRSFGTNIRTCALRMASSSEIYQSLLTILT